MTFDELLTSYDPIDLEYTKKFGIDHITVSRKIDSKYVSFIPTKEEAEKIFQNTINCEVTNGHYSLY